MKKIIVIGGGAAGMMAAYAAAKNNNEVILCERNEKLGKKIYITGKGRCNVTNACDLSDFFDNIFENPSFAYSSIYTFTPDNLVELLEEAGTKTKVERGFRVFPESDKASDVTKALTRLLNKNNVNVMLDTYVKELIIENSVACGVRFLDGKKLRCDAVILCCGGKSYETTGSDGNGYALAKKAGHDIIEPTPALVGIKTKEKWVENLAGLSLKNVSVTLYENNKKKYTQMGEMLFTHTGVSGPVILTMSCLMKKDCEYRISIDLKPALDEKKLDNRILRDFEEFRNKDIKNALVKLLPSSLIGLIVELSEIPPEKKVNQLTVNERKSILDNIKNLSLNVESLGEFKEAIITKGGVDVKQVVSSTMESKIVKNLYFAGEMLALHAFTGGFNLQLAFSTGYLAGESV